MYWEELTIQARPFYGQYLQFEITFGEGRNLNAYMAYYLRILRLFGYSSSKLWL